MRQDSFTPRTRVAAWAATTAVAALVACGGNKGTAPKTAATPAATPAGAATTTASANAAPAAAGRGGGRAGGAGGAGRGAGGAAGRGGAGGAGGAGGGRGAARPAAPPIPAGFVIATTLDKPLTTTNPIGYAFTTTVHTAIPDAAGVPAVPAGAVLHGVVTAVRAAAGGQAAVMGISIENMSMNARFFTIKATVTDVADSATAKLPLIGLDSAKKLFTLPVGAPFGIGVVLGAPNADGVSTLPAGTVLSVKLDTAIAR